MICFCAWDCADHAVGSMESYRSIFYTESNVRTLSFCSRLSMIRLNELDVPHKQNY